LSARFDEMYGDTGRLSIAPERLLKSCVVVALLGAPLLPR
jgi:hypothetical protein